MKKTMTTIGVIAVAIAANAASYSWKADNDSLFLPGQEGSYMTGTAYLLDAAAFSQQDALTAFLGGTSFADKAIDTTTINAAGGISNKSFDYNGQAAESTWQAYFAVIDGDNIFISDLSRTITTPADTSTTPISIGDQYDKTTAALSTSNSFSGAGWYAASVPEPTSGLLLLLGMAGLALKRKCA